MSTAGLKFTESHEWVRIQGEDWQATMHRMKVRIQRAANLHFVAPWEFRVLDEINGDTQCI